MDNMTAFQFVTSFLSDVTDFFADMFSLFPPVIMSFLFFCPAIALVFQIIHYFRDSFRG